MTTAETSGRVSTEGSAEAAPRISRAQGAASWRALGTYVDVRTSPDAVSDAAHLVADVLAEVDLACSRFRDDSDLVRANLTPGPVPVSPVLVAAVRVALEAARETGGLVDPTLGEVLDAAGYDRTFALVPHDDPSPSALPRPGASWAGVWVTDDTVEVPRGAALDLGATGKAFAADLAALTVADTLGVRVLVSVGGDLRVATPTPDVSGPAGPLGPGRSDGSGTRPRDGSSTWPRGTSDPTGYRVTLGDRPEGHSPGDDLGPAVPAEVRLTSGGLATSSVSARRWRRGGRQWHHIVDPRTRDPARGPWRTVTALGHTAAAANTASTAALVLGVDAVAWLADRGVAARLVGHDGEVVRTAQWLASGLEVAS
jgi:FAD:protein FMN transferase